jgi:hypothetical protein
VRFPQFPKQRPPLPPRHAEIYANHYRLNRHGRTAATSLSSRLERWMHRQVAGDAARGRVGGTLEIGAGTLNQLGYEPGSAPYDIVEPFRELYQDSSLLSRVRNVYNDIREVPADARYARITSVATFEHLTDLPAVAGRAGLLLAPGGTLRVAIPSEGTLLWTLGWRLTTGIEYRLRYGLDYGVLMRHEHVNSAVEVREVLRFAFRRVEERVFGLSRALSFYQFYAASDPDPARCAELAGAG